MLCLVMGLSTIAYSASFSKEERKAALFGNVSVKGTSTKVEWALKGTHNKKFSLSSWGLDGSLEYFHGMFYLAKAKKNLNAQSCDGKGGTVHVKKGEQIIIIKASKGTSVARLKNKRTVYMPKKSFQVTKFLYNSSHPYRDAQVEEWVKTQGIDSATNYMFVVSKYNQRGWILTKQSGKWVCKYCIKLTTSSRRDSKNMLPNDCYSLKTCAINTHYKNKKGMGKGISYHSKEGGNQIHYRGNSLYPSTHGCVGMGRTDYNFVYYYLPYKTRVVLF